MSTSGVTSQEYGNPSLAIDIYSLGFAALELLCGNRLARRVSPALAGDQLDTNGWLQWHSSPADHLPTIRELVPNLSPVLSKLIERMTCKQQHERFPDARSCLNALNEGFTLASERIDPVEHRMSEEGIEILGIPPALHEPYEVHSRLSWTQVLKNPTLLLESQGRAHLAFACVSCLMSLSIAILLFQPAQTIDQATDIQPRPSRKSLTALPARLPDRKVDTQVETTAKAEVAQQQIPPTLTSVETHQIVREPLRFDLPEQRRLVYLQVVPRGRVLSVEGIPEEHELPTHWKLEPGTYTTHCIDDDSSREFDFSFDVLNGDSSLLVHIPVPTRDALGTLEAETIDPYADVRGLTYFPSSPAFELNGAMSIELADRQFSAIEKAMLELSRRPYSREAQFPFALPRQAVDPRASFAIALWAYRSADTETAVSMCRKSLADAVDFEVPFVLPLRLLNHIQINHTKAGGLTAALADCRQTLQQFKRLELSRKKPVFEDSVAEIAWWSGILVGYSTEVRRESFQQGLDAQAFETSLRRVCTPSQWEKYRIGRHDVSKRHQLLAQNRADPTSLASTAELEYPHSLPMSSVDYASDHVKSRSDFANPEEQTQEKFGKSQVISPSSPLLFANYRPFDLSSLASEALSTLKPASPNQFAFR